MGLIKASGYMNLEEGNYPGANGESIILTCDRDNVFYNSFFHKSESEGRTETGTFMAQFDNIYISYHEMGHSLSGEFFGFAKIFGIDDTIKLITALSNGFTFNETKFDEFFDHLKEALPEMNVCENYKKRLRGVIIDRGQSFDDLKEEIKQLGATNKGIVKLVHLDSKEIFKNLGIALMKNEEEYTLIINPLSDLALSAELNLPLRADHSSFAVNPQMQEYGFFLPKRPFVNHSLNPEFYGAMLKIYGSSMQKYVLDIMYGDSFIHRMKAEWGLVNNAIVQQLYRNQFLSTH